MAIILLPEGHNDTTERFKRQSRVHFSDLSPETFWRKNAAKWLIVSLVAFLLLVLLFPTQPVKAKVKPVPVVAHKQLLPNFQQHLSAMKACAQGSLPVWTDKTTIQCFKDKP